MTSDTRSTSPVAVRAADDVPAQVGASVRLMAIGLWVVVGSLLAYGIFQTVVKASALFS